MKEEITKGKAEKKVQIAPSFSSKVNEYSKLLSEHKSASWDRLPDIELYMDQVVTFLERELDVYKVADDDKIITSSMINNYTKDRVVPRANKKKYSREHIALMLLVFSLKKVLSMPNMSKLLDDFKIAESKDIEKFYNEFSGFLDEAIDKSTMQVEEFLKSNKTDLSKEKRMLKSLALKLSISGQINCILSEHILSIIDDEKRD